LGAQLVSTPLSRLRDGLADFEQRRPVTVAAVLLLIIATAVLSGAYRKPFAPPERCLLSLLVAHNLLEHRVFSIAAPTQEAPQSGRPMGPAYPALMTALAYGDARLAQGVDCRRLAETQEHAGRYFASLRFVQAAAGIGVLVLVFYLAWELIGSRAIACASVVLFVIGGKLGEFARILEPHNLYALALLLSLYLLAVAYRRKTGLLFAAAGASLGLAALFMPSAALVLAVPLVCAAIGWTGRHRRATDLRAGAAFLLGGLVVIAPWAARNAYLFGDPMLAAQSDALLLSFRVAYNAMPYSEWPLAVLSWVPSYGNMLAELLCGEGAVGRFGLLEPGAYFANGHAIYDAAVSKMPPGGNPFVAVWSENVGAAPVRHLLTSIPVFTRGIWGTHGFMGIVGLCLLPGLLRHLLAGPSRPAAVAVVAVAVSLVVVQALLAPNLYWMNMPMLFVMALAIARTLPAVAGWLDRRLVRIGSMVREERVAP
jgi:hypothetical protein